MKRSASSINDYDLGQVIGRGGFSRVYKGVCRESGANVAVKVAEKEKMRQLGMTERVLNEINLHLSIPQHDKIARAYTSFQDEHCFYLVMELCPQGNFFNFLRRKGRLSELDAKRILYQLLQALQHLHSLNIVHRDLKLSNILVTQDSDNTGANDDLRRSSESLSSRALKDESISIKLCDFGLAVHTGHPDEEHYTLCGTPNYIAPEVATRESHGKPADLWSAGCLFYCLVFGRPPFEDSGVGVGVGSALPQGQPKEVQNTFERIKSGAYTIPDDVEFSSSGQAFLKKLLELNPQRRDSASELMRSSYFDDLADNIGSEDCEDEAREAFSACSAFGAAAETDDDSAIPDVVPMVHLPHPSEEPSVGVNDSNLMKKQGVAQHRLADTRSTGSSPATQWKDRSTVKVALSQRATQDWGSGRRVPCTSPLQGSFQRRSLFMDVASPGTHSVRSSRSWLEGLQELRASVSLHDQQDRSTTLRGIRNDENEHTDENKPSPVVERRPLERIPTTSTTSSPRAPLSELAVRASMSSSLTDCSSLSDGHFALTDSLHDGRSAENRLRASYQDFTASTTQQLWVSNTDLIEPFCYMTGDGELVILTTEKDVLMVIPVVSKKGRPSYARLFLERNAPLVLKVGSVNSRMQEQIEKLLSHCQKDADNSTPSTTALTPTFLNCRISSKTCYFIDSMNDFNTKRLWMHRHHLSRLSSTIQTAYRKLCNVLTIVLSRAPKMVLYLKLGTVLNLLVEKFPEMNDTFITRAEQRRSTEIFEREEDSDSDNDNEYDTFSRASYDSAGDSKETNNSKRIPLSESLFNTSDSNANETSMVTNTTTGASFDTSLESRGDTTADRGVHPAKASGGKIPKRIEENVAITLNEEIKDKIDMKCTLMANDPLPDFSIQWMDGTYLHYCLCTGSMKITCLEGQPRWNSVPFHCSGVSADLEARKTVFIGETPDNEKVHGCSLLDITDRDEESVVVKNDSCEEYSDRVALAAQYHGNIGALSLRGGTSQKWNDAEADIPLRFRGYVLLAQLAIQKIFSERRHSGHVSSKVVKTI